MEIIIAKTAGFCHGVKNAVNNSMKLIKNSKNKQIYCLGELAHNKQVISDLERKGLKFIEDIKEIKEQNSKVIIRSHGVAKEIYDYAKRNNIEIVDCTCSNVLRMHKIAEKYQKKGYYIFLTGIENHPEIIGTSSYCGEHYNLITEEDDVEKAINDFKKTNKKKLLVMSQTTYNVKKFEKIKYMIKEKISKDIDLVIKDTICLATERRQKEAKELAKKVDKIIVIGGKNSSNTKKLFEIALQENENVICVETKAELENADFKNVEKIGIIAGASTPQKSIDDIEDFLKNI